MEIDKVVVAGSDGKTQSSQARTRSESLPTARCADALPDVIEGKNDVAGCVDAVQSSGSDVDADDRHVIVTDTGHTSAQESTPTGGVQAASPLKDASPELLAETRAALTSTDGTARGTKRPRTAAAAAVSGAPPAVNPAAVAPPLSLPADVNRYEDMLTPLLNNSGGLLEGPQAAARFIAIMPQFITHPARQLAWVVLRMTTPAVLAAVMAAGAAPFVQEWLSDAVATIAAGGADADSCRCFVVEMLSTLVPLPATREFMVGNKGLTKLIGNLRSHGNAAVAEAAKAVVGKWRAAAGIIVQTHSRIGAKAVSAAADARGRAAAPPVDAAAARPSKRSKPDDGSQQDQGAATASAPLSMVCDDDMFRAAATRRSAAPPKAAGPTARKGSPQLRPSSAAREPEQLRAGAMGMECASPQRASTQLLPSTCESPLKASTRVVTDRSGKHHVRLSLQVAQEPQQQAKAGGAVAASTAAPATAARSAAPRPAVSFPNLSVGLAGGRAQAASSKSRFAAALRARAAASGVAVAAPGAGGDASSPGSSPGSSGGGSFSDSAAAMEGRGGRRVAFKRLNDLESVRWFRKDEEPNKVNRDATFTLQEEAELRAAAPGGAGGAAQPQQLQRAAFGAAARQEHLHERRLLRAHQEAAEAARALELRGLQALKPSIAWAPPPLVYINPAWQLALGAESSEAPALAAAAAGGGGAAAAVGGDSPAEPVDAEQRYGHAIAGLTGVGGPIEQAVRIIPFELPEPEQLQVPAAGGAEGSPSLGPMAVEAAHPVAPSLLPPQAMQQCATEPQLAQQLHAQAWQASQPLPVQPLPLMAMQVEYAPQTQAVPPQAIPQVMPPQAMPAQQLQAAHAAAPAPSGQVSGSQLPPSMVPGRQQEVAQLLGSLLELLARVGAPALHAAQPVPVTGHPQPIHLQVPPPGHGQAALLAQHQQQQAVYMGVQPCPGDSQQQQLGQAPLPHTLQPPPAPEPHHLVPPPPHGVAPVATLLAQPVPAMQLPYQAGPPEQQQQPTFRFAAPPPPPPQQQQPQGQQPFHQPVGEPFHQPPGEQQQQQQQAPPRPWPEFQEQGIGPDRRRHDLPPRDADGQAPDARHAGERPAHVSEPYCAPWWGAAPGRGRGGPRPAHRPSSSKPCLYFNRPGGCNRGPSCKFLHAQADSIDVRGR